FHGLHTPRAKLVTTETWEESASGEFPTIQLLKFQEQPTVIIASTKADKAFLNALATPAEEGGSKFFVKTVKSNLFGYEHAQNRLTFLQWSGMPQGLNASQRLQLLNTKIRLEDDVQVRALGALLTVLQQEMILDNVEVTDNDGDSASLGVRIGSISQLNLDGFLSVDAWTLNSLQIFQSDKHPSPMGIGKTKEGFSVFGLLNKCVTAGGRSMLRMWFLRPIVELQFEGDNGDGAASFYHTDKTRELDQVLGDVFHKILDMESVIIRDLEGRVLEHSDALTVAFAVAAEIDCLVSLALSAREFNLKQPRLTKENVLKITNGR
ncbi:unnamed protein product, partial [Closterium sp. Naga37s-1]